MAVNSTLPGMEKPVIKVAVPNKGSLSEPASQMLREAGYAQRSDRELALLDEVNGVEFFYLRPRDIAVYVGEGTLDVGITGRDMLLDSVRTRAKFCPRVRPQPVPLLRPRRAARCRWTSCMSRLATSYPGLVGAYLQDHGVSYPAHRGDGAGKLPSGSELPMSLPMWSNRHHVAQAGLELSAIRSCFRGDLDPAYGRGDALRPDLLERRLNGVLVARNYVMMDYTSRCPCEEACAITPGLESPTVSPLAKEGWRAVRAMVPRADAQQIMDDLWALGARAILVTDIAACRI